MKFKREQSTDFYDLWLKIKKYLLSLTERILLIGSVAVFLSVVFDMGFTNGEYEQELSIFYSFALVVFFITLLLRLILQLLGRIRKNYFSDTLVILVLLLIIFQRYYNYFHGLGFIDSQLFMNLFFIVFFFIEISKYSMELKNLNINPPMIYAGSFLFFILVGTMLLLLPNSTVNGISLTDALFTSTSAVCVTGLIVVDTATYFTPFGKAIILILFQAGGLGVMTFTSFFGFFFQGQSSYKNQVMLKDFVNEEQMGEVFKTLLKIIVFTLIVEAAGAFLIYIVLDPGLFPGEGAKIKFSVFHAVSAFCNAGFSTLTDGLYHESLRYLYNVHLIIAFLVIIGGLGFPVVFNYYRYLKFNFFSGVKMVVYKQKFQYAPRIISANTKIIVYTTLLLLGIGTVLIFIAEYNNQLQGLSWYGKIVTSFFASVTARSAGFNTFDTGTLSISSILILILLMWIGGSPGSTAGGIKTSTFALAILNTISISRSKDRIEVFRREIAVESVRRAFAIILLSFLVMGVAVFLLTIFEPEKNIMAIVFECFSAYGVSGLSMGITPELSVPGKIVITLSMFLGRVGMLTILIGLIKDVRNLNYRYPSEGIFMN